MPVKPVASEAVAVAASTEWERIKAKIDKKLGNKKALPLKKGEVKSYVAGIVREVVG